MQKTAERCIRKKRNINIQKRNVFCIAIIDFSFKYMWEIKRKLTTDNDYLYTIYIYIRYIHMTLKRNYNLKARQDPWWTLRQFGKLMRSNSYANTYTIYKERDIYRTPLTRIKSNPLASWFFAYPKYTITHTHTPTYTQPKRNEKKCKNCLYILCNYFVFF